LYVIFYEGALAFVSRLGSMKTILMNCPNVDVHFLQQTASEEKIIRTVPFCIVYDSCVGS